MTLNVHCESCGRQHTLERPVRTPQVVFLLCHACETSLRVEVTRDMLRVDLPVSPRPAKEVR